MIVIGRDLGNEAEQVFVGDEELGVETWEPDRVKAFPPRPVSGRLRLTRAGWRRDARGPLIYPRHTSDRQGEAHPLIEAYEAYVDRYAEENDLTEDPRWPGWAAWMKNELAERERYAFAFQKQTVEKLLNGSKHIEVAYHYHNDVPYRVLEPWPTRRDREQLGEEAWNRAQESAHMRYLERLMTAAFPTYLFFFVFEGNPRTADVVVYANHPDNRYLWTETLSEVRVGTDTNLVHEMGHFLLAGTWHHYPGNDHRGQAPGQSMPPGEIQPCTMDRDFGHWCNACAAGLGIPVRELDPRAFNRLRQEFFRHYRPGRD